jgi:hypothetical protein
MTKVVPETEPAPLISHLPPVIQLTEGQFFEFRRW